MLAIDTKALVRLLTRDDARQLAIAQDFVAKGAWVSHLVLAEAIWVLDSVFELPRERLAAAVAMLLDHEHLSLHDPDVVSRALDHFRAQSGVGFSDCLVLEIARKAGHTPLGSFDRALARLDGVERLG